MNQSTLRPASTWKQRALATFYLGARYYAAFTALSYGFAKVMGAQFTVLDSQLAKPMGDVSGFWLTWYYFGISPVYAGIVAGAQIVGAIFLCFRRTTLIGALLLLPVMINVVSIDHWIIHWNLDSDALRIALYVLAALLVILAFHVKELYGFFLQRRSHLALLTRPRSWMMAAQVIIVLGMIAYTAHEAYWIANVNNRAPTAIDGAWHLVQSQPSRSDLPDWIYFEYNRAYMVVFKFPNGKMETHDFRVDPKEKTIQISEQWLTPGSDVLSGKWVRTGNNLVIEGRWGATPIVTMTFQRKEMPIKDHR